MTMHSSEESQETKDEYIYNLLEKILYRKEILNIPLNILDNKQYQFRLLINSIKILSEFKGEGRAIPKLQEINSMDIEIQNPSHVPCILYFLWQMLKE